MRYSSNGISMRNHSAEDQTTTVTRNSGTLFHSIITKEQRKSEEKMGLDAEFTAILREIVQFLECLRDANLSTALETVRESLLLRSKNTLSIFALTERSMSPEPYLNMKASPKGLQETREEDSQEYVGLEDAKNRKQKRPMSQIYPDHYETFRNLEEERRRDKEEDTEEENALMGIYFSFSAAQAKSKCLKYGSLYRKEGKKLFVFEQYRACWAALVGGHLLIYGNERDSRPYAVHNIRGYSGRPAPTAIPRDPRRSESAFEVFKPGNKTLQFIARTPKDMEEWVEKICHMGCSEKLNVDEGSNDKEEPSISPLMEKLIEADEASSNERLTMSPKLQMTTFLEGSDNNYDNKNAESERERSNYDTKPPPLPARRPRRLPSVPSADVTTPSYETMCDEEDDIYHRIEDFQDKSSYQNVKTLTSKSQKQCTKSVRLSAYDDVRAVLKQEGPQSAAKSKVERDLESCKTQEHVQVIVEKTYDDIAIKEAKNEPPICKEDQNCAKESANKMIDDSVAYDDVGGAASGGCSSGTAANGSTTPNKMRDKIEEEQKKIPHKKSFLDRMRNRKESPRKKEKKSADQMECSSSSPVKQCSQVEETPMYDDVFDLVSKRTSFVDESPEYNSPPPPRPIYARPPPVNISIKVEEFYDDVGCQRKVVSDTNSMNSQQQQQQQQRLQQCAVKPDVCNITEKIVEEVEHYQTPRSDSWPRAVTIHQENEQLYDDIAILANFTARRKILDEERNKDQELSKSFCSSDKKVWNRFVMHKKSKSSDSTGSKTNSRGSFSELEDFDYNNEQQTFVKLNTFQKLINKMENSLGKTNTKTVTNSPTKTNALNTSS